MAYTLLGRSLIDRSRMPRPGGEFSLVIAAVLVAGATNACVFTDPINVPPTVEIIAPTMIWRGQGAEFTARTVDDQAELPYLEWAHVAGRCPTDRGQASWPRPRVRVERYPVPSDATTAPFCVWAFATDRYQAVGFATYDSDPANHTPTAEIELLGPEPAAAYPLFSEFRLSGAKSADLDRDKLVYEWNLVRAPPGSTAALVTCDPIEPLRCFTANVAGEYQVGLIVRDGFSMSIQEIKTFSVLADAPPCLTKTSPTFEAPELVHDPETDDHFQVLLVADDGDPLPGGPQGLARFVWGLARGDDDMAYVDRNIPWFDVPRSTFAVGDSARVRVEVYDRNSQSIDQVLLSCGDEDFCAARPGCFQRVTWKIQYR